MLPLGLHPKAPQPEDSTTSSATSSEIQCAANYHQRKASLRNPAFWDQEFTALSMVDAYLGAAPSAFDQSLDVLSRGMQVRFYPNSWDFEFRILD